MKTTRKSKSLILSEQLRMDYYDSLKREESRRKDAKKRLAKRRRQKEKGKQTAH